MCNERKIEQHKMSVENKIKMRGEKKHTLLSKTQYAWDYGCLCVYLILCLLSVIRAMESRLS